MDTPEVRVGDALIVGADESTMNFVREWCDSSTPYVTAHTSGSTGTPKAIRLLKSDMLVSARATVDFFNLQPCATLALPLSADYIAGKMMIVRASIIPRSTLIVERPSLTPFEKITQEISLAAIVPSQIPGLIESGARIDNVIVGGAPMTSAQERMLVESGINAYATFGMTETCSHIALRRISASDEPYATLDGIIVSTDSRGCLVIHSERMSFGTLVTNDVVNVTDPRHFRWLGRADNVIISGGVKLHPESMERELAREIPDITFYITSRPSEQWGSESVMMVERNESWESDELIINRIYDAIERTFPRRMRPKDVIIVDHFRRTSSHKIIRLSPERS